MLQRCPSGLPSLEGLPLAGESWAWGQSLQWSDPPVLHPQVLSMSSLRPSAGSVGALEPTHWPCVCSTWPSTNAGHTDRYIRQNWGKIPADLFWSGGGYTTQIILLNTRNGDGPWAVSLALTLPSPARRLQQAWSTLQSIWEGKTHKHNGHYPCPGQLFNATK